MLTRRHPSPSGREQALSKLQEAGISIPQWALANGFSVATTKAVLYGHVKGVRGEAHRVAVALGIKNGPIINPKGYQPVRRTDVKLTAVKGAR